MKVYGRDNSPAGSTEGFHEEVDSKIRQIIGGWEKIT